MREHGNETASDKQEIQRRQTRLNRLEHLAELPLIILSIFMIPLLVGPLFWQLTPIEEASFFAVDGIIWAIFATYLGVKFLFWPDKRSFVRNNWVDIIVVFLPFFRPLRLLRLFAFGSRASVRFKKITDVDSVFVYAIGLVVISSTIIASTEMQNNPSINTFADSLWWSLVTVTTVGYGDIVPQTVIGRAMGVILMISGVGLFGIVTANLASFLVRTEESKEASLNLLVGKIDALRQEIAELRNESSFQTPASGV